MWKKLALNATVIALIGAGLGLAPAPASAGPDHAPARLTAAAPDLSPAALTYSISRCGNDTGRVLLTFDDWAYGDPYRATRMGEYLRSLNIRAAFFFVNEFASRYPDIVDTLRQQGHWVLNHTWGHVDLTRQSDADAAGQISNGVASNRLRPPGGAANSRVADIAAGLGYSLCTWTIDSRDWQYVGGVRRSVSSIRSLVSSAPWSAKSSGVILGHLFTNFPAAVPGIISDLHAQGLLFCRNRGPVGQDMPFPLTCT